MTGTHMKVQNVIVYKRYVRNFHFDFQGKLPKFTVVYIGGRKQDFVLDYAPEKQEQHGFIAACESELEDRRSIPVESRPYGVENLYVQIGNKIIKGRIIQSVYFKNDIPQVIVTYLNGRKEVIDLEDFLTEDEIDVIFNEICAVHEEPCYPSEDDGSGCPLGMASI